MQNDVREFIDGYLRGDDETVDQVDRWIRAAASPYYRQLAHQWDDVLQDLRLEVFRELRKDRFREEASVKTYLWRLVCHSCLDHLRSARRWQWTELPENDAGEAFVSRPGSERAVPIETSDLVLRVLDRVGDECRRLWRRIVAGASYREMSRELGVSEGALRVRALRCRREALKIRDRLLRAGREEV